MATKAKIIVVFFGGRPRLLDSIPDNADAILIAFLPGPTAGRSILEIVNGSTNPSARLPITYPKYQDGGGVPYYSQVSDQCTKSVSGNPHEPLPHWIYTSKCEVLYPFGHGLSYTTFTYSNLAISKNFIEYAPLSTDKNNDSILVTVEIQNTGNRMGDEICYFFIFDESRHVTPEYKRLIGFERVSLDVRQKKTISLVVSTDMLDYVGPHDDKHRILQMGQRFRVGVGAYTDCRNEDELCTEALLLDVEKGNDYIPSCEYACKSLDSKGCLSKQPMTIDQCYNLCKDSSSPNTNESGWGWNYVNCIESILYNDRWSDANQCNTVNSMCRNVFAVNRSKSQIPNGEEKEEDIRRTILAAILAGIFGTITIMYPFFKVELKKKSHQARDKSGIEFGLISQQENELI